MLYLNSIDVKDHEYFDSGDLRTTTQEVAYRVPAGADHGLLLLYSFDQNTITIKAGDSVFSGKDLTFTCSEGYYGVFLNLTEFIQHSGPHKGCVLLESIEEYESKLFILSK